MINCVTDKGSLLNYAILNNQESEVKFLIEQVININAFAGIELITAFEMKMSSIATILINSDIEMMLEKIQTNPLLKAIRYECKCNIEHLIFKRPDVLQIYNNEYVRNLTALDAAKRTKNTELIDIVAISMEKINK